MLLKERAKRRDAMDAYSTKVKRFRWKSRGVKFHREGAQGRDARSEDNHTHGERHAHNALHTSCESA